MLVEVCALMLNVCDRERCSHNKVTLNSMFIIQRIWVVCFTASASPASDEGKCIGKRRSNLNPEYALLWGRCIPSRSGSHNGLNERVISSEIVIHCVPDGHNRNYFAALLVNSRHWFFCIFVIDANCYRIVRSFYKTLAPRTLNLRDHGMNWRINQEKCDDSLHVIISNREIPCHSGAIFDWIFSTLSHISTPKN